MSKFNMTREESIFYAKRMIVDSIWKEANLEGIKATFPQTQEIYDGRTVAGLSVEGTVAINNLKHAWWFLLDTLDESLSDECLKQLNRKIGAGIIRNAGELRDFNVMISGNNYRPPVPDEKAISDCIEEIIKIEDAELRGLTAFSKIAKAQFFPDGNKRTAQLVANKILIEGGAGILSIPVDERANFGRHLINYYENDDIDDLISYLSKTSLHGIEYPEKD